MKTPKLIYITEDIMVATVKAALDHGWKIGEHSLSPPKGDVREGWASEWTMCETLGIRVPMYLFCVKRDENGSLRTAFFTKDGKDLIRGEIK